MLQSQDRIVNQGALMEEHQRMLRPSDHSVMPQSYKQTKMSLAVLVLP